ACRTTLHRDREDPDSEMCNRPSNHRFLRFPHDSVASTCRRSSRLMWSREGITLEDFYAALLDFVKTAEEHREQGQQARMGRAESRRRILGQIGDENVQKELDLLLKNVSFLFYRRGYNDSEHHQKALNPIRR